MTESRNGKSFISLSKARNLGGNIGVRFTWAALWELHSSSCLESRKEKWFLLWIQCCPELCPGCFSPVSDDQLKHTCIAKYDAIQSKLPALPSRSVLIVTCLLKGLWNYLWSISTQWALGLNTVLFSCPTWEVPRVHSQEPLFLHGHLQVSCEAMTSCTKTKLYFTSLTV